MEENDMEDILKEIMKILNPEDNEDDNEEEKEKWLAVRKRELLTERYHEYSKRREVPWGETSVDFSPLHVYCRCHLWVAELTFTRPKSICGMSVLYIPGIRYPHPQHVVVFDF